MKQYGRPRHMGPKGQVNLCCGGCNSHDENGQDKNWRKRARRENKREVDKGESSRDDWMMDYLMYENEE